MTDLTKTYNPAGVEDKWYAKWLENKLFRSVPDERTPYTIVIPPPNVTGVLHMGHVLNNTLQDVLIRKARMEGYNACWVPGTDHASIATEAKVVQWLKQQGIEKKDLTREQFLEYCWQWTHKHGGIILEQLKKLGASCDWERTRFTMEKDLYDAVITVFIDLYEKGKIYRGYRMINWDPEAHTALSDEEVIYREVKGKLYYVRYPVKGSNEFVTIATTRPETILGDTAVCIHPDDPRYQHLKGKTAIVPLVNREVPIIEDDYIDMEFGTGCLKVTPAHDANDYELGQKHNLEIIDILNEDGTLNENAVYYVGEDRFTVREKIVKDLEKEGYLVKVEDYTHKVGFSERTDAVVEPRLSVQWFVKMKELAKPALENVLNGNIKFHPPKFINTYKHWMENVHDWCISRQLWWGQRIPAWYNQKGEFVVARTEEEAREKFKALYPQSDNTQIRQDEDVLDTWFSSWLWPISVFDGFKDPDNPDINYYYPTDTLVTAPEILFFWVARMIMAGYEYRGEKPFKDVYLTGIVRDKKRRKMSKSLGNSPEPLDLIAKYGADGVRVGMLLCAPAGNDLLFDEKLCEQGRNFANKIWNALRLVKGWKTHEGEDHALTPAVAWFDSRLSETITAIENAFAQFRISEALMLLYTLIWDDFCSWYLEMIKPRKGESLSQEVYDRTIDFFETLMKLIHPFMPFISEEIYHQLKSRDEGDFIAVSTWPGPQEVNTQWLEYGNFIKMVVTGLRDFRNTHNVPTREQLEIAVKTENPAIYQTFEYIVGKLANVRLVSINDSLPSDWPSLVIGKDELRIHTTQQIDIEERREKLLKELEYTRGFVKSVEAKLKNERFVQNAPQAVVERERKKLEDGITRLKMLEEALSKLN